MAAGSAAIEGRRTLPSETTSSGFFSLRVPGRLWSVQHESSWTFGTGSGDGPSTRNKKHHRERTENDELSF